VVVIQQFLELLTKLVLHDFPPNLICFMLAILQNCKFYWNDEEKALIRNISHSETGIKN
jgi:hypothetical protein